MPIFPGTRPATGGSSLLKDGDSLLFPSGGANVLTLAAPTNANYKFTLPPDGGAADQVLRTDGAGNTTWVPIASAPVDSVFGRTGAVVAQQADYDAFFLTPAEGDAAYAPLSHVGGTGAAHGAFTNTVAGFAPASGGGTANYLRADGTWAAPPGTTPPVDSVFGRTGAVVAQQADYDAFFLTPAEGDAAYAPLSHVGDTGAAHGVFTDTVDGFTPSSPGGTTTFLRADGAWAVPPGGGGGSAAWESVTGQFRAKTDADGAQAGDRFVYTSRIAAAQGDTPAHLFDTENDLGTDDYVAGFADQGGIRVRIGVGQQNAARIQVLDTGGTPISLLGVNGASGMGILALGSVVGNTYEDGGRGGEIRVTSKTSGNSAQRNVGWIALQSSEETAGDNTMIALAGSPTYGLRIIDNGRNFGRQFSVFDPGLDNEVGLSPTGVLSRHLTDGAANPLMRVQARTALTLSPLLELGDDYGTAFARKWAVLADGKYGPEAYKLPEVDGSSGQVLKTDGGGAVTWQNESGGGGGGASLAIDLPPYASEPPASNFATLSTRAAGLDDPRPTLIYADSGLVVAAMWTTHVPPGYGGGDLRFTVDWAGENGATGGDVAWRVRIEPIADDSTDITIAPTWTYIDLVTDQAPAATQKTSAEVTGDPGAISAGQLLRVRLERVGDDVGDTLAAGAEVHGLLMEEV